nr:hypothetical protein [Tanacetum cinerariifolium]
MSSDTKLTKDKECESVDSTMYRDMIEVNVLCQTSGHLTSTGGLYQTNPPSPDEIILYIQVEREDVVTRVHHDKVIDVEDNQILTREIVTIMKTWVDIICENVFCLEFVTKQARLILPYGMLLTRLFKYVMSESPELSNNRYVLYDCVMYPLTAQQERKNRKDYDTGRGRSFTSSSSAFDQPSSSHPNDDDDDDENDEWTSGTSTPSLTRFVNSLSNDIPQIFSNPSNELAEYINTPSWNRPAFYNYDDDDIVITPEEPDNSLSMGDEHLDTILAMKSDEVIKSSVEDLFRILSESESIPDDTCDVPFCDNSPPLDVSKDQFEDFSDSNDDSTSIDDDYFSIDDIDYVEVSPPDSELISLEEVKDNILHEKLLNIHLLIDKIESLNDNPTLDRVLKSLSPFSIPVEDNDSFFEKSDTSLSYSDNSLPEFETFSDHTEETSSGSTTTHVDYSLLKYDSFLFKIEPDQGELTSVVMEDNLGEPRVHVTNVLPTYPTLMLDSDFTPSDNSLPESEIF